MHDCDKALATPALFFALQHSILGNYSARMHVIAGLTRNP